MGLLIYSGGKSDHQLAVPKYADGTHLFKPVGHPGQALHGISECKSFGFVVGPPRSIVSSCSYNLLLVLVQDDESSCPMSVLCSSIKLDVDVWSRLEPGSRWQVNRLPEGSFGGLHVI